MARKPRVFVDGAIYHVYCRVGRGEAVFAEEREVRDLLDHVREVKARDDLQILAWCVMSNHYHLVVRSATVPLWRTMRLLQGRFTKSYNSRHRTFGPLWQGRYGARLVSGDRDIVHSIAYVHLNPVAAGVVRDPARYRWSGHLELLGEVREPLADVDAALLSFGDPVDAARRIYARTLSELSGAPWVERSPGNLPWWRAERGRRGAREAGGPPRPVVDATGASTAPERHRLTAAEFIALAAVAAGTSETELRSPRSGSALTRQRELLALLAVELFGVRVKELAEAFGRDPGTVSRWVNAAGDRRAADPAYRRAAGEVADAVSAAERAARAARAGFVFASDGV